MSPYSANMASKLFAGRAIHARSPRVPETRGPGGRLMARCLGRPPDGSRSGARAAAEARHLADADAVPRRAAAVGVRGADARLDRRDAAALLSPRHAAV